MTADPNTQEATGAPFPPVGLELCFAGLRFPPPWFVPVEAPACGAVIDVAAERTNDGIVRHFTCDRPAGHTDHPGPPPDKHRQVLDNETGNTLEWADGAATTDPPATPAT